MKFKLKPKDDRSNQEGFLPLLPRRYKLYSLFVVLNAIVLALITGKIPLHFFEVNKEFFMSSTRYVLLLGLVIFAFARNKVEDFAVNISRGGALGMAIWFGLLYGAIASDKDAIEIVMAAVLFYLGMFWCGDRIIYLFRPNTKKP